MAKKDLKLEGWAWYSKNQGAIVIGMRGEDGKVDRGLMFVVFAGDLQDVKDGKRKSARVYKSVSLYSASDKEDKKDTK